MNWKPKKHDLLGLLPENLVLTRTRDSALRYLSFDDGPEPGYTPRLLDTLAKHGVKASFFLVGRKRSNGIRISSSGSSTKGT